MGGLLLLAMDGFSHICCQLGSTSSLQVVTWGTSLFRVWHVVERGMFERVSCDVGPPILNTYQPRLPYSRQVKKASYRLISICLPHVLGTLFSNVWRTHIYIYFILLVKHSACWSATKRIRWMLPPIIISLLSSLNPWPY
jgi:hypothetical protein